MNPAVRALHARPRAGLRERIDRRRAAPPKKQPPAPPRRVPMALVRRVAPATTIVAAPVHVEELHPLAPTPLSAPLARTSGPGPSVHEDEDDAPPMFPLEEDDAPDVIDVDPSFTDDVPLEDGEDDELAGLSGITPDIFNPIKPDFLPRRIVGAAVDGVLGMFSKQARGKLEELATPDWPFLVGVGALAAGGGYLLWRHYRGKRKKGQKR